MKPVNALDRPWLNRYRRIIASMLPDTANPGEHPPYQQIAHFVTAGKLVRLPDCITASHGQDITKAVWHAIGNLQADPLQVRAVLSQVIAVQSNIGRILPATSDDQPESVWYYELQLTHALATAGLLLDHEPFIAAALRAAAFILNEIQPDHATNRPWGLNAFLLSDETLPLADWMLHTTAVHLMTTPDPVTLLLLRDCLYCLPE